MTKNGQIGSFSWDDERARGAGHDPVILSGVLASGQGELPVGLMLSRNASDELIPYVEANGVAGILDEDVNTDNELSAVIVVHGSVRLDVLKGNTNGDAPTETELRALRDAGIYPA